MLIRICIGWEDFMVKYMAFEASNPETYADDFVERFLKLILCFLWGK